MVTSRFPPLLGGTETHVYEVARRMSAKGLDVTVLTTDLSGQLPRYEDDGGLVVRRFPAWPRRADLYVSPTLLREITGGGYDLLHVQGVNNFLPPTALAVAHRAGIPTVVTFHSGGHSSRLRSAIRETQFRAQRPLLRRSAALIAVCNYEVDVFSRRLGIDPHEIRLIRNGAQRIPDDGSIPDVSGSPLVCSVGRLERYKGHQRLIAAMPWLLGLAPEAHLALVGHGTYDQQLRQLVAKLDVGHAVTFTSFDASSRGALGALLRSSDIVALMSDYEANPVAVMEALAFGRKVVVAATSGLTELASQGLATAVPPSTDPAVLARILASVAGSPTPDVPDLPTWDDCVTRLLELYAEIFATHS